MGEALVRGLLQARLVRPQDVLVCDPSRERREHLERTYRTRPAAGNAELARRCSLVFLAVKPQHAPQVLAEIGPEVGRGTLLVSIVAGLPLPAIERHLGAPARLVRAMPNTPALVGAGATAVCYGGSATGADRALVRRMFDAVGRTVEVEEGLMDAVTGLSGSGPAFVFTVIQALADGGVQAGLPRATALQLAAQTVLGAARMVLETGAHPIQLRDQVASPGGTTIQGIAALEAAAVPGGIMGAVLAATEQSRALARKHAP
jgi:pyrroline-5-carboxylate reductase